MAQDFPPDAVVVTVEGSWNQLLRDKRLLSPYKQSLRFCFFVFAGSVALPVNSIRNAESMNTPTLSQTAHDVTTRGRGEQRSQQ